MASPEDLTDVSTSCGSSVQSACFEAPSAKEDPLDNGAIVAQSALVEESLAPEAEGAADGEAVDVSEKEDSVEAEAPASRGALMAEIGAAPGGVPVMAMPLNHLNHPELVILDPMVPYSMAPSFPIPPVPMHLPDGTDLDLSKPPPIAPIAPYGAAPAPYSGTYQLPYSYTAYPHINLYDPNTNIVYQNPEGAVLIPMIIPAHPGMIPAQPLAPTQPPGTPATLLAGSSAPATAAPSANAPLPPMPAAGVTPLAAVEGTAPPPPPAGEFQRTFSQEATESLKSLLNISSDNSPSNLQQPNGIPFSHGMTP